MPDETGPSPDAPIGEPSARLLARRFSLRQAEVMSDARTVAGWAEPGDDLLVWLERRHGWSPRVALIYLQALRRALNRRGEER